MCAQLVGIVATGLEARASAICSACSDAVIPPFVTGSICTPRLLLVDVALKFIWRVQALAERDRHRQLARLPRMAGNIFRDGWLLVLVQPELFEPSSALKRRSSASSALQAMFASSIKSN
jgi:hypothetical protein